MKDEVNYIVMRFRPIYILALSAGLAAFSAGPASAIIVQGGEYSVYPGVFSNSTPSRTLRIWPSTGSWSGNTHHELTISTSAIDYQGLSMAQALQFRFITMLEAGQDNTVVSPDGSALVTLPAGALGRDAYLVFNSSPAQNPRRVDPQKMRAATAKLQAGRGKFYQHRDRYRRTL